VIWLARFGRDSSPAEVGACSGGGAGLYFQPRRGKTEQGEKVGGMRSSSVPLDERKKEKEKREEETN
jgi:hypothetical protein